MAPSKSSDGGTKDGYSGEMETSTDVASSLLGKRKVEFSTPEDSRESEEDVEDSDSDWDKDSFDGVEYEPSDGNEEYSDEEFHQKCVCYRRAVIETKGFFEDSKDFPPFLWSGIAPVPDLDEKFDENMTTREFIGNMACVCVEEYNKRNMKNLKYERVLRANFNPGGRTTYYITIAARECDDAPLVEYQAKVIWCAGETYPILCRPSPSPKKVEGDGRGQVA